MNARLNQGRHVDLPTGQAFQRVTVPGYEIPQNVCPLWPECECAADCTAGSERAGRMRLVLKGLVAATAIIGVGLLYAGLR